MNETTRIKCLEPCGCCDYCEYCGQWGQLYERAYRHPDDMDPNGWFWAGMLLCSTCDALDLSGAQLSHGPPDSTTTE